MKLKVLVKLIESIFKIQEHGEKPRADMFLPLWLLAFGMLLVGGALASIIAFIVTGLIVLLIVSILCALLGVLAILCWRNQTIVIISDTSFEYTTFLGNKKVYYFYDIVGIKQNSDSTTIVLKDGKVHIEMCAFISDRLEERIMKQIEILMKENDYEKY